MMLKFENLKDLLIYNIKYYRYVNNYSQERLAELSKLSPRYITDVERGLHCPTIPKIESIAKSLNIEPYMLFINVDRELDIVNKMKQTRQYNQK
ncbi:MAG: helix-turn-helix transcriptional regulator [Bacilli bacterium]|nr:helix-turn-helix transcriptional regulator [Bacilli bacterium]